MKLTEVFDKKKPGLSFEVFPPKSDGDWQTVETAVMEIAALSPSFMSVTCGAGGSQGGYTVELAEKIQRRLSVTPIAHMTCIGSDRQRLSTRLSELKSANIENILALRGDIPKQGRGEDCFQFAYELVEFIKSEGDFCVGGACYPEGHPESENQRRDIEMLKLKVDAGCSFLTTQMFFDNNILYNFLYKIREAGISVPVVAGIMPVTNARQIKRIIELSGTSLPRRFVSIIDRFGSDTAAMRQAGIAHAMGQIVDLFANGVNCVHVYTMNKPDVAAAIIQGLSEIIK